MVTWFINALNLLKSTNHTFLVALGIAMLKLVLFAYTRSVFSSRNIEKLAEESLLARWLTQEQILSYHTIAHFRVSNELETLIEKGLDSLIHYFGERQLINDSVFIDGTKFLADVNKYSFVCKKSTVKYDRMNREQIISLLKKHM